MSCTSSSDSDNTPTRQTYTIDSSCEVAVTLGTTGLKLIGVDVGEGLSRLSSKACTLIATKQFDYCHSSFVPAANKIVVCPSN